jgi:cAMP-dependent protein kinase regulator
MTAKARKHRPLAPTTALDYALQELAENRPEDCLRRAVPVLDDVGAGAPALDIVGRAAASMGAMHIARAAFEGAARALAIQGMASHAVAAALAVHRLTGNDEILPELASVLGADAPRPTDVSVRPPPLMSDEVKPLDLPRAALLEVAEKRVAEQRARLPGKLPVRARHPLWGALPSGAFERFARSLEVRLFRTSERVLVEGDPGASVFLIARGEVRVARTLPGDPPDVALSLGEGRPTFPSPVPAGMEELAVIGAEMVFGEMALLTAAPRAASALTTRASLILEAPRAALDLASQESHALGDELRAYGRRRLVQNLLRTAPLLRNVPGDEREPLANAFETRVYTPGEAIFTQGADSPGLHLIASGRVSVRRNEPERGDVQVATIGAGGCVGEISLVLRRPTTATVTAMEPTVALVLRPNHFMDVVKHHPKLLAFLYELAVSREEELHSVVAQSAEDADDLLMV